MDLVKIVDEHPDTELYPCPFELARELNVQYYLGTESSHDDDIISSVYALPGSSAAVIAWKNGDVFYHPDLLSGDPPSRHRPSEGFVTAFATVLHDTPSRILCGLSTGRVAVLDVKNTKNFPVVIDTMYRGPVISMIYTAPHNRVIVAVFEGSSESPFVQGRAHLVVFDHPSTFRWVPSKPLVIPAFASALEEKLLPVNLHQCSRDSVLVSYNSSDVHVSVIDLDNPDHLRVLFPFPKVSGQVARPCSVLWFSNQQLLFSTPDSDIVVVCVKGGAWHLHILRSVSGEYPKDWELLSSSSLVFQRDLIHDYRVLAISSSPGTVTQLRYGRHHRDQKVQNTPKK
ncbi:uncharacterized protein EV420DRAFT_1650430 [Desarmillaria tabescens]|uniref:Uncharacterized protein n=1 Tax=Armillaria tabescens TaxID=1929756 RepID=A0AA39JF66_ARMTA|nr:uncharacterized protein EV420DRAFT_1650430 [Desarmillaria tabescens]KAK0440681.1 hypothetical protein EV420DRAFT_1650430 [Desarmillaria tabescens]